MINAQSTVNNNLYSVSPTAYKKTTRARLKERIAGRIAKVSNSFGASKTINSDTFHISPKQSPTVTHPLSSSLEMVGKAVGTSSSEDSKGRGTCKVKEKVNPARVNKRGILDKLNYQLYKKGHNLGTKQFKEFCANESDARCDFVNELANEYSKRAVLAAYEKIFGVDAGIKEILSEKERRALLVTTRDLFYQQRVKCYKIYLNLKTTINVEIDATAQIREQLGLNTRPQIIDILANLRELEAKIDQALSKDPFVPLTIKDSIQHIKLLKEYTEFSAKQFFAMKKMIVDAAADDAITCSENFLLPFDTDKMLCERVETKAYQYFDPLSEKEAYSAILAKLDCHKEIHNKAMAAKREDILKLNLHLARTVKDWSFLQQENNKYKCLELLDFAVTMKFNAERKQIDIEHGANSVCFPIEIYIEKLNAAMSKIKDPTFNRMLIDNFNVANDCMLVGEKDGKFYLKKPDYAKNSLIHTARSITQQIYYKRDFLHAKRKILNQLQEFLNPYNARIKDGGERYSLLKQPRACLRQLKNMLFKANSDVRMVERVCAYSIRVSNTDSMSELLNIMEEIRLNPKLRKLSAAMGFASTQF